MWSRPIAVTAVTTSERPKTLVASTRPPMPASTTSQSVPARRAITRAIAVVRAKKVGGSQWKRARGVGSDLLDGGDDLLPRWQFVGHHEALTDVVHVGDWWSPTDPPAARSEAATRRATVPLPAVPTTCTARTRSCGSSNRTSNCTDASRARSPRGRQAAQSEGAIARPSRDRATSPPDHPFCSLRTRYPWIPPYGTVPPYRTVLDGDS